MPKLHELRRTKAALKAEMRTLAQKAADLPEGEELSKEDTDRFGQLESQVADHDKRIDLLERAQGEDGDEADPVAPDGETTDPEGKGKGKDGDMDDEAEKAIALLRRKGITVPAAAAVKFDKGIVFAGIAKMLAKGGGSAFLAAMEAKAIYGERHPVTKALSTGSGAAGGFVVPPDYVAEVIELLRAQTVVRDAGVRNLPMPRGTLTLPRQSQAASAGYGAELSAIPVSEQRLDQIVATYKKLTALVPISNDLMRYSDPAIDALVRDDLVQVIARREDLAFIRGDGTQDSPRGFRSFALAGSFLNSNFAYTQQTVNSELAGAMSRLRSANVPQVKPCWIFHPRTELYLYSLLNQLGNYVYRDEMSTGKLMGIPYKTTTQIPVNLTVGGNTSLTEVYLVEMSQAVLLDSMSMEMSVSREATYVDANGNQVSTFQQDQTLVRSISEHDFQMRHDEAIAVINGVAWQPS